MSSLILLLQSDITNTSIEKISASDGLGSLYVPILSFILICVLAYFTSKFLASSKSLRGRNSELKIYEVMSVGYQKSLQLVKVGKRFMLIAVTKDNVSFLSEVSNEDLEGNDGEMDSAEPASEKNTFERYLKKFISKNREH